MASWVREIFCRMWILVLWAGVSTSSYILLCLAASQGERLSGTWRAAIGVVTTLGGGVNVDGGTLGGVTTLGGGTIDEVNEVVSGSVVCATQNGM